MDTYSIYDFYSFVEKISIIFALGFAVILFFCVLAFLNTWNVEMDKKRLIFCIVIAILFVVCLSCGIYMNYLQIR